MCGSHRLHAAPASTQYSVTPYETSPPAVLCKRGLVFVSCSPTIMTCRLAQEACVCVFVVLVACSAGITRDVSGRSGCINSKAHHKPVAVQRSVQQRPTAWLTALANCRPATAVSRSDGKEDSFLLCNLNVHYRLQNSLTMHDLRLTPRHK
jgi:hypothetical protein